jgi:hypothetical protein
LMGFAELYRCRATARIVYRVATNQLVAYACD